MLTNEYIDQAHTVIEEALARTPTKPRLLCSFGKDSLVMLDLLAQHGVNDVLHLEDLDEKVDRDFNVAVTEYYSLTVTKLPLGRGIFSIIRGEPTYVALVSVNHSLVMPIPTEIETWTEADGGDFHCLDEKLDATRGVMLPIETDLMFSGIKRADFTNGCRFVAHHLEDAREYETRYTPQPIYDAVPGDDRVKVCAPLIHWTDEEVWQYIHKYSVPWSRAVYADDGTRKPYPHKCCYRCHDPNMPPFVQCPRTNLQVLNTSSITKENHYALLRMRDLGLITEDERKQLEAA